MPCLMLAMALLTSCAGGASRICGPGERCRGEVQARRGSRERVWHSWGSGPAGSGPDAEAWGDGGGDPAELDPDAEAWGTPGILPPVRTASEDADARKAEARLFNDQVWAIASTRDRDGATLEFTAWASGGALTLESFKDLTPPGSVPSQSLGDAPFKKALQKALATYLNDLTGQVVLAFHRKGIGWLVSVNPKKVPALPSYAKTLPVNQREIPPAAHDAIEKALGAWVSQLHEPERPGAEWNLEVALDDDRIEGISTLGYQLHGAVAPERSHLLLVWEMTNVLLLHSDGVGRRKVKVVLRAEQVPGQRFPRWRPVESSTVRLPMPELPEEEMTTAAEYQQMHERILRQWREDSAHYAMAAALFTAREAAFWIVGGWAERGFGAALHLAASPLGRAIERLGPRAAPWLDCVLRRMEPAERKALLELWSKLEVQGEKGLAETERSRLRIILQRIERLAVTPLDELEKKDFRNVARRRIKKFLDPELVAKLVDSKGNFYPVHHLIPLEYFELFEIDINAIENLVALEPNVHDSVGRIWTALRAGRATPTAAEVQRTAEIINHCYGRWYNKPFDLATSRTQLQSAENAAKAALGSLLNGR